LRAIGGPGEGLRVRGVPSRRTSRGHPHSAQGSLASGGGGNVLGQRNGVQRLKLKQLKILGGEMMFRVAARLVRVVHLVRSNFHAHFSQHEWPGISGPH